MSNDVPRFAYPVKRTDPTKPPEEYAKALQEEPVCPISLATGNPAWFVTRHADVRTVLSDRRFSREALFQPGAPRAQVVEPDPDSLLNMDPPRHTALRRLANRAFSAKRVERLRPYILHGMTRITGRPGPRVAFFDVDETLIAVRSMPSFLRHQFAAEGRPGSDFTDAMRELRGLAARGRSRAELSLAYYRNYAGCKTEEVAAQGRDWFEAELRSGELLLPESLKAFRRHLDGGDLTVLISGSFGACLDPLAEWLGARLAFGARLEVADGRYTGRLVNAMIGKDKEAEVLRVVRDAGIDRAECYAYGDHSSDLPMLRAVGHPVVVGSDPVLKEAASAAGWSCLPGVSPS